MIRITEAQARARYFRAVKNGWTKSAVKWGVIWGRMLPLTPGELARRTGQ